MSDQDNILNDKEVATAIVTMSPAKLSAKDIYEHLCASRDREIDLVWRRAVFLTAFLIACFTAYGGLLAAYIGNAPKGNAPFTVVSVAAIGIGIIGILLSIIWIQMAKGSKAWYEHYEDVIECFVKNHPSDDLDVFAKGDYRALLHSHNLDNKNVFYRLRTSPLNDCLFSSSGGKFSVSKIVIVMGQLFLGIWTIIVVFHSVYLFGQGDGSNHQVETKLESPCLSSLLWVAFVLLLLLAVTAGWLVFGKSVKSGYLKDLEIHRYERGFLNAIRTWLQAHCLLRKWCKVVPPPSNK